MAFFSMKQPATADEIDVPARDHVRGSRGAARRRDDAPARHGGGDGIVRARAQQQRRDARFARGELQAAAGGQRQIGDLAQHRGEAAAAQRFLDGQRVSAWSRTGTRISRSSGSPNDDEAGSVEILAGQTHRAGRVRSDSRASSVVPRAVAAPSIAAPEASSRTPQAGRARQGGVDRGDAQSVMTAAPAPGPSRS